MAKHIHVTARRWFDRRNGNTYHSVTVIADGEEVGSVPFAYGYGDHWEQTAAELLTRKGVLDARTPLRISLEDEHGIRYTRDVSDVARKRDL